MIKTSGADLAASLTRALAAGAALPAGYRRRSLVLEVSLPANAPAATTATVRRLLGDHWIAVLGSRGTTTTQLTLYATAAEDTWRAFADWLTAHPTPRPIAGFDLAAAHVTVEADVPADAAWAVTLHPDADASLPDTMVPASPAQLAAFAAAVTGVGGELAGPARPIGATTYLPIRLPGPDAARTLAACNTVRSVRPMPQVSVC